MKISYRSNLTAGIVSILLGAACFLIIPQQIAEDFTVTYGITSRSIPYAIAALWVVCGAVLVFQSLILKKDEKKTLELEKEVKALGYMAVLLIYGFLFQKSFLISTMFLGVATLAFTGLKKKRFYLIVLLTVFILYLLFSRILHVQMP